MRNHLYMAGYFANVHHVHLNAIKAVDQITCVGVYSYVFSGLQGSMFH